MEDYAIYVYKTKISVWKNKKEDGIDLKGDLITIETETFEYIKNIHNIKELYNFMKEHKHDNFNISI